MTRVLLVVNGLDRGGTERLVVEIALRLDRARFEPEVAYLMAGYDALAPELADGGVRVHCLGGADDWRWLARLRRLVGARRPALLHAHSVLAALGARLAPARPRPPVVYTEHNVWASYPPPMRWPNLLTYWRNRHVFAVSERVRTAARPPSLLRWLPMPPVETLYHGFVPETGAPPDRAAIRRELGVPLDAPLVGSVAHFRPEKGHLDLVEAVARVREAVPDVRVVLVGEGPEEPAVRRRVATLGLEETVSFAGARDDAARLVGAFDVFASASLYEGLPLAVLEAMAAGVPTVVPAVGGLAEAVDHRRTGVVVPPGDRAALAAGVGELLADRALRDRLGAAARERAASFDLVAAVRRIEAVYDEVLR